MKRSAAKKKGAGRTMTAQQPKRLKDHDVCATDPNVEQWPPTDEVPIKQHKRMAGVT